MKLNYVGRALEAVNRTTDRLSLRAAVLEDSVFRLIRLLEEIKIIILVSMVQVRQQYSVNRQNY